MRNARQFCRKPLSRASLILEARLRRYFQCVSELALDRQRLGPAKLTGTIPDSDATGISDVDDDDDLRVSWLWSEGLQDMNIALSGRIW